ncbi:4-hydroxyphenylacetate 3-monooxygenase, reductase component [Escherichia coli]|nr:4-hydroxyphenylacetate 3-monooxygenase, reductase component [Escherichia coli]EKS0330237.1 4-hydroxyphenylacetate 3-monooxygenase, reductase component [Escherichia coli]
MQLDEQRLRFRDAMASLSAAVNIITTEGDAGQCGITATAVCSVTDTPPSLMVCINANSAMNPVFQGNGKLCVNVLNHEQELMARHFAGMTGMAMEERFSLSCWQKGPLAQPVLKGSLAQPVLKGSLASLEGEIRDVQAIGTHLVYLVEIKNIILSAEGHGLIYFKRRFHPVMLEMEAAI